MRKLVLLSLFIFISTCAYSAATVATCDVTITVLSQTGAALTGLQVKAKFISFSDGTRESSGGAVVASTDQVQYTDADGSVVFTVPQASHIKFCFNGEYDSFYETKVIPSSATANYEDLTDA